MSAFKQMSDQLSGFLDAAEASHKSACQERDELMHRLAILEAAVRAYRDDPYPEHGVSRDKLYALVSEVSK